MLLTVVIPTFNRAQSLELSLQTINIQTISRDKFGLVIVDNALDEETKRVAERFGAEYFQEPKIGLQHARNRGMEAANTPWVLYLDDDIKAPSDLVEKFLDRLQKAEYDGLGGKATHWFATPPPKWLYRYYQEPLCPSPQQHYGELKKEEYLLGGIMAIRKEAWKKVGGFTPGFSMIGNKVGRGGEDEFQQRLRANGFRIFYDPSLCLEHLVQPYKYSFQGQFQLAFASGKSGVGMRGEKALNWWAMLLWLFRITFYSLPFNLARLLFKRGYYWQNAFVDTVKKYYYVAGQFRAGNPTTTNA